MTVAKLIAELQKMPQDAEAVVNAKRGELANGNPVTWVHTGRLYRWSDDPRSTPHWDYDPEYDDPEYTYTPAVNITS